MQQITRVRPAVLSGRSNSLLAAKSPLVESKDAKAFRDVAFATGTITTITDSGAHDFTYDGLRILFHCTRTLEPHRIQVAFPGLQTQNPGLVGTQDYPELGVRIHCDERTCSLFPIAGQPLAVGERYVHFLLRMGKRPMLVSVSISMRGITQPSAARYTRNTRVNAAFAVFETRMQNAFVEMREEIQRIIENEIAATLPKE